VKWDNILEDTSLISSTKATWKSQKNINIMSSSDSETMNRRNQYKRPYYCSIDHQGDHDPSDKDVDWSWQRYPSYLNSTNSDSMGEVDGNRVRELNKYTLPPEWAFDDDNNFMQYAFYTGKMKTWYKQKMKHDRDKQYLANKDKDYNI